MQAESDDQIKSFIHPDGNVVILPKLPISKLRGIVRTRKGPVTIEEMEEAVISGAAESAQGREL